MTAGYRANGFGVLDESMVSMADDPDRTRDDSTTENRELRSELDRLRGLLGFDVRSASGHEQSWEPTCFSEAMRHVDVDHASTASDKLTLYRSLFGGRTDVYANRWESSWTGKSGWSPTVRGGWSPKSKRNRASYDRFFPSQDVISRGSFENLIALPLHGDCVRCDTTVFLDPTTMTPRPDQWAFLSSVARMSARLKHLASISNPTFHEKERLRFSTWDTPRFIRCYREDLDWLSVPRGLIDPITRLVAEAGSGLDLTDNRTAPEPIDLDNARRRQDSARVRSHRTPRSTPVRIRRRGRISDQSEARRHGRRRHEDRL